MIRLPTFGLLLMLAACASAPSTADGSAATSGQPASYSRAQARAGAEAYAAACTTCHASDLSGSKEAPALTGADFVRAWDGRPAIDLIRFARQHMPKSFPGVLNDRTYLGLVAYILARNGVPAGAPLTGDTLSRLLLRR